MFDEKKIPFWAEAVAESLLEALRAKDPLTADHCLRVGESAGLLAKASGLSEYEVQSARFAGYFHDIGKIAVSSDIIHKPARLTASEMEEMRSHPLHSAEIIAPLSGDEFFAQLIPAVRHHHERMDGQGYPDGLKGEEIPLLSRVILVVDTYDAMAETRAYRKGLPDDVVYAELQRCSGTQFDPRLVTLFLENHSQWAKIISFEDRKRRSTLKAA